MDDFFNTTANRGAGSTQTGKRALSAREMVEQFTESKKARDINDVRAFVERFLKTLSSTICGSDCEEAHPVKDKLHSLLATGFDPSATTKRPTASIVREARRIVGEDNSAYLQTGISLLWTGEPTFEDGSNADYMQWNDQTNTLFPSSLDAGKNDSAATIVLRTLMLKNLREALDEYDKTYLQLLHAIVPIVSYLLSEPFTWVAALVHEQERIKNGGSPNALLSKLVDEVSNKNGGTGSALKWKKVWELVSDKQDNFLEPLDMKTASVHFEWWTKQCPIIHNFLNNSVKAIEVPEKIDVDGHDGAADNILMAAALSGVLTLLANNLDTTERNREFLPFLRNSVLDLTRNPTQFPHDPVLFDGAFETNAQVQSASLHSYQDLCRRFSNAQLQDAASRAAEAPTSMRASLMFYRARETRPVTNETSNVFYPNNVEWETDQRDSRLYYGIGYAALASGLTQNPVCSSGSYEPSKFNGPHLSDMAVHSTLGQQRIELATGSDSITQTRIQTRVSASSMHRIRSHLIASVYRRFALHTDDTARLDGVSVALQSWHLRRLLWMPAFLPTQVASQVDDVNSGKVDVNLTASALIAEIADDGMRLAIQPRDDKSVSLSTVLLTASLCKICQFTCQAITDQETHTSFKDLYATVDVEAPFSEKTIVCSTSLPGIYQWSSSDSPPLSLNPNASLQSFPLGTTANDMALRELRDSNIVGVVFSKTLAEPPQLKRYRLTSQYEAGRFSDYYNGFYEDDKRLGEQTDGRVYTGFNTVMQMCRRYGLLKSAAAPSSTTHTPLDDGAECAQALNALCQAMTAGVRMIASMKTCADAIKFASDALDHIQSKQDGDTSSPDGSNPLKPFGTQPLTDSGERQRREAVWFEVLRELSVSGDPLLVFLKTLSGIIHQDVRAIIDVQDQSMDMLQRQRNDQRREIVKASIAFSQRSMETLLQSVFRSSSFRVDVESTAEVQSRNLSAQLVVVGDDTVAKLKELISGNSNSTFFEAQAQMTSFLEQRKGRPIPLQQLVTGIRSIVEENMQTNINAMDASQSQGPQGALSYLSQPRNSFVVRLHDDTFSAISTAYYHLVTEMQTTGLGMIVPTAYQCIEGSNRALTTQFAALAGYFLSQSRLFSSSSAIYVSQMAASSNTTMLHIALKKTVRRAVEAYRGF